MRLYSKHHLTPRLCASKDGTRYGLAGVHFDADGRTWATDGHIFARFEGPTDPPEEYPQIPEGPEAKAGDVEPFTLPTDAAERVRKAIPKRSGTMPVLANAALDTEASRGNGHVRFWTTDLEHPQRIDAPKVEGEWPRESGETILERARENPHRVVISGRLLQTLAKMALELAPDGKAGSAWPAEIELRIADPTPRTDESGDPLPIAPGTPTLQAVYFRTSHPDAGELEGCVMPMRV